MKILVLGGNGFLGSHLCNALSDDGHVVRIYDRHGSRPCVPLHSNIEYIGGDFSEQGLIDHALTGCEIVIHLISTTLPKTSNEDPIYDLQSNLLDTLRLLESARRKGVRKILFSSSGGTIYGVPKTIPIKENHPTDPICSYGINKLAIEKYLHLYQYLHQLPYCVLRIANPYGEGQLPTRIQGAISVFTHKAIRGEIIQVWGDGSVVRDYIYISDVISAFLKALAYEGQCRIFNIGSGCGHSINEILNTIELVNQRKIIRQYSDARSFDVQTNVLDIGAAKQHLGWSPVVSLHDGLLRTMAWVNAEK